MADLESLMNVTKAKIGELISKPKMSDKLLSKPPFRFLHDTITAITTTTGFGEGLYSDGELDSAAITEKQAKLNYLDKSFRLVGICKGALLDVKSSKVVSGLEPELTNMFLIALAECASDPKFDNAAAVRRALNGENPGDNPPPLKSISDPRPMIAESKSEPPKSSTSKSVPAAESESKSSSGSAKAVPAESKLQEVQESSAAPAVERGKSRGGTRGGKPNQASTDIGISGISGAAAPNLDSEIEKCDGSEAATQALLGSLITRPKLTEKLLSKPPFRFLHDIVMEVIKATGFATGLYSPAETDSANVADKTQKMTFLEKIIKLVGVQLNTLVEAKPARIVAGMDAQNTNNWLQLLAVAAKNLPDSRSAVRTVLDQLEGGGGGSGPAPSEPQPAVVVAAVEPEPVATSRGAAAKQEREVDDPPSRRSQPPPQKPTSQEQQQQFAEAKEPVYAPPPQQSYPSSRMEDRRDLASAPASDEKMQDDSNIGGGGDDTESKRSSRPTTARRRPPKVKDGAQEIQAKDIASTAKKAEGIIIDGAGDEVDEEDDIKPSDDLRLADEMRADFKSAGASSSAASERNDPQSKLVKDIMSRQAEQEAASRASSVAGKISTAYLAVLYYVMYVCMHH